MWELKMERRKGTGSAVEENEVDEEKEEAPEENAQEAEMKEGCEQESEV
jgi:hypothetical protein